MVGSALLSSHTVDEVVSAHGLRVFPDPVGQARAEAVRIVGGRARSQGGEAAAPSTP
ncbi:hypothetical protein ACH3Y9_10335 [Streptomyces sp. WSLK1-5]|uniref:hypothetical protein n=1 Tax=unclassified Streptomyces TaxID=2593676 RepID=UPI00163A7514|nr:hypothetical protein [Streptomyces sp. RP5T]